MVCECLFVCVWYVCVCLCLCFLVVSVFVCVILCVCGECLFGV